MFNAALLILYEGTVGLILPMEKAPRELEICMMTPRRPGNSRNGAYAWDTRAGPIALTCKTRRAATGSMSKAFSPVAAFASQT